MDSRAIEAALLGGVVIRACFQFSVTSGGPSDAFALLLLALCTSCVDHLRLFKEFRVRNAMSCGLQQCIIAIPLLLAAIAVHLHSDLWVALYQGSVCCGFLLLSYLCSEQSNSHPNKNAVLPAANTYQLGSIANHNGTQQTKGPTATSIHASTSTLQAQQNPPKYRHLTELAPWVFSSLAVLFAARIVHMTSSQLQPFSFTSMHQLPFTWVLLSITFLASSAIFKYIFTHLPYSFTIGEATIITQCIVLCMACCVQALYTQVTSTGSTFLCLQLHGHISMPAPYTPDDHGNVQLFVLLLLFWTCAFTYCLHTYVRTMPSANQHCARTFQVATGVSMIGVIYSALSILDLAVWVLFRFLHLDPHRFHILLYWVVLMCAALPGMLCLLHCHYIPHIIMRKGYHILAVALFLPAFIWDRNMLAVSLAIAFTMLMAVETARCCGVPHLAPLIQRFMRGFADARDSGLVYVTHFTLLLGIAGPVWLSYVCSAHNQLQQGQLLHPERARLMPLVGLSGLVSLGVGDTAASVFGSVFGRVPIARGSRKTVEGTLASILSMVLAWWAVFQWCLPYGMLGFGEMRQVVVASIVAGLLEAITTQLDNLVVPIFYAALLFV